MAIRHRLIPEERTDDPVEITRSLVGLHGSDPATVFLSAAVRMRSPSIEATEASLYDQRTLVRHHAMRRTVWIMDVDTMRRAHASSTRKIAGAERRRLVRAMEEASPIEGPDAWLDAAMDEVLDYIRTNDLTTTRQLGEDLPHLRVPIRFPAGGGRTLEIAAHARVVLQAGFEGAVVRARPLGSWISSQYRWSSADRWLPGGFDTLDTRPAAAALLAQWLERFGPGTGNDLRWWSGWTTSQLRTALEDCGAEPVALEDGATGWVAAGDTEPVDGPSDEPWVALLPGLDPTPMGWKERSWYLDADVVARCVDRSGNIGPTIWAGGRVVGGWVQRPDGELALEILRDLSHDETALLRTETDRLTALLGEARFRVRFPAPNQKELCADPPRLWPRLHELRSGTRASSGPIRLLAP